MSINTISKWGWLKTGGATINSTSKWGWLVTVGASLPSDPLGISMGMIYLNGIKEKMIDHPGLKTASTHFLGLTEGEKISDV